MDYYATIKKNEEAINVLLRKNLQNIIKGEEKGTEQRNICNAFCVKGKRKAYHELSLPFKKLN